MNKVLKGKHNEQPDELNGALLCLVFGRTYLILVFNDLRWLLCNNGLKLNMYVLGKVNIEEWLFYSSKLESLRIYSGLFPLRVSYDAFATVYDWNETHITSVFIHYRITQKTLYPY